MQKSLIITLATLMVLAVVASGVYAGRGNQMPSGPHYNLNIIGSPKTKEVGDSWGHTLFVKLNGKTKINMTQDEDGEFYVVDRNGTDGTAEFNIAPGYYNVFARALGKPIPDTVQINASGEFFDALDGMKLIWLGMVNLTREKGKPQTVNINELFYVDVLLCKAVEADVCVEWVEYTDTWVFDIEELYNYFWEYDNVGLRLMQIRFYPCTIDPTGTVDDYCRWGDGTPIEPTKRTITTQ
jgi:hypothetical protein